MKKVVVTGIGIKSCIGYSYKDVLHSLQNGKSGIVKNQTYTDMNFRSQISGSIDIDLKEVIDSKLLRFMGEATAYALSLIHI